MKDIDLKHFKALTDVFLNSINRKNYTITATVSRFFYDAFKKEREKSPNSPVIYPDAYYELVYKTIEELALQKNRKYAYLEKTTAGSIWLLGEIPGHEISDVTYTWMWRNLLLAIQYQRDNMVLDHWESSHQYITYSLGYIYSEYDQSSGNLEIINNEQVEKRKFNRERFLEFHYALGGLLMYKERYECIKRMFDYTTSEPAKYELLPESMDEIFKFYFKIRDPYDREYTWISHKYSFPEQSGLKADSVVKKWIYSYMAILFLRQYTIIPYLITMRPLEYPHTPQTQGEIKAWIDGLDFFKKLVSEHLNNRELIKKLNLEFLTVQWCVNNEKVYPLDFIDYFKSNLQKVYQNNALTLPISQAKVTQFEVSTKKIIEETYDLISKISISDPIEGDLDKWYVKGQRMLQSKDAFSENPEVHHIDFDSFLASVLARRIVEGISSTFLFKKTKTYLFKPVDLFEAIDKLNLSDKHLIVTFGFNIDQYINYYKIPGLSIEKYQETNILSYSGSQLVNTSIFILRISDIPRIDTKPISDEIIEKYSLKKISDKINLYSSIIDLNNTSQEIFNENKEGKEDDELRKSVLMSIIISIEILWKKNIDVIQLMEFSEYRQKGLPNKLSEIEPIEKKKPSR